MRQHSAANQSRVSVGRTGGGRPTHRHRSHYNGERASLALAEAARDLAATLDVPQATNLVVSTVFRLFRVARAVLYQLDETSGTLVCIAAVGKIDPRKWVGQNVPITEGIVGQAVQQGRPIWVPDALEDTNLRRPDWLQTRLQSEGYRSLVALPLIARGHRLGAVVVADRLRRSFTKEDLNLLAAFADQAALSLENARLYQEAQRRLRQTETLLAVSDAAASTLDLSESTRRVTRELTRALGGDLGGTYLADASLDFLRPISGYHVPTDLLDLFLKVPIPLRGHPFLEEAWSQRRSVLSQDADTDPRLDRAIFDRFPHRSIIFVPMTVRDAAIGGLFVAWWTKRHRFTPEDVRLAEGIARQAALLVANAQLYAELQETADTSEGLLGWIESLASVRDLEGVLESIVRLTPAVLGVQRCGLFLFERTAKLVPARTWGLAEDLASTFHWLQDLSELQTFAATVTSDSPTVLDNQALSALIPPEGTRRFDIRSMLVIPLVSADERIGIMVLDSPGVEHLFSPRQLALARAIGTRAGVAIATARLFRERRRGLGAMVATREDPL